MPSGSTKKSDTKSKISSKSGRKEEVANTGKKSSVYGRSGDDSKKKKSSLQAPPEESSTSHPKVGPNPDPRPRPKPRPGTSGREISDLRIDDSSPVQSLAASDDDDYNDNTPTVNDTGGAITNASKYGYRIGETSNRAAYQSNNTSVTQTTMRYEGSYDYEQSDDFVSGGRGNGLDRVSSGTSQYPYIVGGTNNKPSYPTSTPKTTQTSVRYSNDEFEEENYDMTRGNGLGKTDTNTNQLNQYPSSIDIMSNNKVSSTDTGRLARYTFDKERDDLRSGNGQQQSSPSSQYQYIARSPRTSYTPYERQSGSDFPSQPVGYTSTRSPVVQGVSGASQPRYGQFTGVSDSRYGIQTGPLYTQPATTPYSDEDSDGQYGSDDESVSQQHAQQPSRRQEASKPEKKVSRPQKSETERKKGRPKEGQKTRR